MNRLAVLSATAGWRNRSEALSTPFFRGANFTDWLVALLFQSAADFGDVEAVKNVAGIIGESRCTRYLASTVFFPDIYVCYTHEYAFVISASTQGSVQWVGNVLGSTSDTIEFVDGDVSSYFGTAATVQWLTVEKDLRANKGTRRLVLIGFSLGAATVTILKGIFKKANGFDSACFAFASPRAGADGFAEAFPSENYQGITVALDPVPSVPPKVWTKNGIFSGYKPVTPFAHYANPEPAWVFDGNNKIMTGFFDMDLVNVFRSLYSGDVFRVHNQPFYALAIRTNLPDFMVAGFDGFPNAFLIDHLAPQVLYPVPMWPWPKGVFHLFPSGGSGMGSQIGIFMRDQTRKKGFEEVYYSSSAASSGALDAVKTLLLPVRARMLASNLSPSQVTGMEIFAARVSNVGSPRQSFLYKPNAPLLGTRPFLEGMATIEQCAVYQGFDASNLFKRSFHFRGIDGGDCGDEAIPAGGYLDTIINGASPTSLLAVLRLLAVSIHSTRAVPPVNYPVTGATQAAQGTLITLAVGNPAGFVPGTLWDLRGVRGAPLLNGRWMAAGPQIANQIVLSGSQRYTAPTTITGTLFQVGPNYQALDHMALLGAGKKDTGRPPFSPRGRRSPQLRRR